MLPGVEAKFERARETMSTLLQDVERWGAANPSPTFDVEREADGWTTWYFTPGPTPPLSFSVRVGEVAQHLRASLDHTVWGLVEANGHTPTRSNQFPIGIRPEHYAGSQSTRNMLKGVAPDAVKVIDSHQHFEPNGSLGLATVLAMSNLDKHRTLYAAQGWNHARNWSLRYNSSFSDHRQLETKLPESDFRAGERRWLMRARVKSLTSPDAVDLSEKMDIILDRWDPTVVFPVAYEGIEVNPKAISIPPIIDDIERILVSLDPWL